MTAEAIGVVLESSSIDTGAAAVDAAHPVRPGSFLLIVDAGQQILAIVRGVRWAGGIFTSETAGYHLAHLSRVQDRRESTWQYLELGFVGSVTADEDLERRSRGLAAGALVYRPNTPDLIRWLGLAAHDGVPLGTLTSHADVPVTLPISDLTRAHTAVVGQTGAGKTNVLKLVHNSIRGVPRDFGYVLFDFHDEFTPTDQEVALLPPFAFGASDLQWDLLTELLPGLTVPQQDLLSASLATRPKELSDLISRVESAGGSDASRRVLLRRLERIRQAHVFSAKDDLPQKVVHLASQPGSAIVIRLGGVHADMAQLFIGSVVRRLLHERMRKPGVPILLVVDEAHRLMSATASPSATRSFRFIAQEGRKFGVTLLLATQRPGLVDQTILSQCATMIAMRLASTDDARVVSQATAEIRANELGSLAIGQGLIRRASSPDVLWVDFKQALAGPPPEARRRAKPAVLQQLVFEED